MVWHCLWLFDTWPTSDQVWRVGLSFNWKGIYSLNPSEMKGNINNCPLIDKYKLTKPFHQKNEERLQAIVKFSSWSLNEKRFQAIVKFSSFQCHSKPIWGYLTITISSILIKLVKMVKRIKLLHLVISFIQVRNSCFFFKFRCFSLLISCFLVP